MNCGTNLNFPLHMRGVLHPGRRGLDSGMKLLYTLRRACIVPYYCADGQGHGLRNIIYLSQLTAII